MLYFLSPTYFVITKLKDGKSEARRTRLLRIWSRGAAILTMAAAIVFMFVEWHSHLNRWITMGLAILAFWRANEIVFAFYKDAFDRLGGIRQTTTFTSPERLKFVALSYIEIIICFGFTYFGVQTALAFLLPSAVQAFKTPLPSLADAIYLSSTIITTLGYGDSDPLAWVARLLSIWEVISGLILFAIALAVYLGSEKDLSPLRCADQSTSNGQSE